MAKPIESRSVKVSISILEKREGEYGQGTDVGSMDITVALPASAEAIGKATTNAVETLARNADIFRGMVPVQPATSDVVDA